MKKLFVLLLITVVSFSFLVSCGKTDVDTPAGEDAVEIYKVENLDKYVFVDMQDQASVAGQLVDELQSVIFDATGLKLRVVPAYQSNTYEILIGKTNREASTKALAELGYYDYSIKLEKNKIIIAGGSDQALLKAAQLFKSEFLDLGEKALYLPDDYSYTYEYPIEKLSVEGVDIEKFKILNNSLLKEEEISESLRRAFDFEIAFAEEKLESEHYIILDASSYIYDEYSITVEDGNIRLYGSARSVYGALEAFSEDFLRELEGDEYDLTSADKLEGSIKKREIYTKEQLMSVLTEVYNDSEHIIIGEQSRGQLNAVRDSIKSFENATGGEKPGILGFDFSTTSGGIFSDVGIDMRVKMSYMLCDMIDYAADGGILTFSAHWKNPSDNYPDEENPYRGNLGYDNTQAGYEKAFAELLTPGTEYNNRFMELLDEEVEFFTALRDNGVPVIWRPLHETNGNWFWFCTIQAGYTLEASYIKNIWYYVHDYFEEKGLDNLLWCYAPNYSANINDTPGKTMSTTYLYPGDEYCDIVGVDWYTEGDLELMDGEGYLRLVDHAEKPGTLTEFGATGSALGEDGKASPEAYSCMNVYRDIMELKGEGYSFSYLMTWGGSWAIALMGEGEEFMAQEMTLGQAEVKALFDKLK